MKNDIYYLPGYGGELNTGLGEELLRRGLAVSGRSTTGDFAALPFSEQVDLVAGDLKEKFWTAESRVIVNSFGAYLFLHAQSKIPSYIGKVLMLSPIVGDFSSDDGLRMFSPPGSGVLQKLVCEGSYQAPSRCEIHVGSEDWQSEPGSVGEFAAVLKIPFHIVESNGHMLDKAYVKNLLDQWLN